MFGLVQLPWWGYILVLFVLVEVTILSVTLYLHRCQAHRALDMHPIISHFFRFWLWLTTGMVTKEWTAIHRKHHARVETDEDPHSPVTLGIKKVFWQGAELYRKESKNEETLTRYGEGTPDDWMERHIYDAHSTLGIKIMLVTNLLLFGTMGLTIWALQMAAIPLCAAGIINGIGHYWGYRNYEVKDNSRNIIPFALLLGGEELHNNHHAFATSCKFSEKWYEVDIGWSAIKLLQWVGLAKAKRVVPQPKMISTKTCIDKDTLTAVISYRFQLMAQYSRDVVIPVLREEKKRAGKASRSLLRYAKTVLIREESIMQPSQRERLKIVLENFQSLRVIYQFRINLQNIWGRSTANQKELIDALQDWCQQAEATGIEKLRQFSNCLKTYVPQRS